jgi:hypothetical protein
MSGDVENSVNPYAPSVFPATFDATGELGVGVWRDGNLLVVHWQAELPQVCVKTGEVATAFMEMTVKARNPDTRPPQFTLRVPVSQRAIRARIRWPRVGFAAALLGGVGFLLSLFIPRDLLPIYVWPGIWAAVFGGVGLIVASRYSQFLDIVRRDGEYFWFAGAGEAFLRNFPTWPKL